MTSSVRLHKLQKLAQMLQLFKQSKSGVNKLHNMQKLF